MDLTQYVVLVEHHRADDKDNVYLVPVGTAERKENGEIVVSLDALPISGKLILRVKR